MEHLILLVTEQALELAIEQAGLQSVEGGSGGVWMVVALVVLFGLLRFVLAYKVNSKTQRVQL